MIGASTGVTFSCWRAITMLGFAPLVAGGVDDRLRLPAARYETSGRRRQRVSDALLPATSRIKVTRSDCGAFALVFEGDVTRRSEPSTTRTACWCVTFSRARPEGAVSNATTGALNGAVTQTGRTYAIRVAGLELIRQQTDRGIQRAGRTVVEAGPHHFDESATTWPAEPSVDPSAPPPSGTGRSRAAIADVMRRSLAAPTASPERRALSGAGGPGRPSRRPRRVRSRRGWRGCREWCA